MNKREIQEELTSAMIINNTLMGKAFFRDDTEGMDLIAEVNEILVDIWDSMLDSQE